MKKNLSNSALQTTFSDNRRAWPVCGCFALLAACAQTTSNVPVQPPPQAAQEFIPPPASQSPPAAEGVVPEQRPISSGVAPQPVQVAPQPLPVAAGGDGQDMPIGDAGGQPQTYVVRKGDKLLKIADCFKTTVDAIMDLNPKIKDPNLIILNQKLLLPGNLVNHCKLPEDVCLNVPGHQPSVPVGMSLDSRGNCVPNPGAADECPNIPGVQPAIPDSMIKDPGGSCVAPPLPRPPAQPAQRAAAPPVPPVPMMVDLCPNLPGAQRAVPVGMIKDPTGSCVAVYVPCDTAFRRDFAGGQRKVLLSSGSASGLFIKYLRAAEARRVDVNLEALVVVMYVRSGDQMELISISAPKLSVWQNATGKHEREWLRLMQDKHAERLPAPLEVGEHLRADVVCGE